MERASLASRDLEHKLIVASFCKYLDDYLASPPTPGAATDESLVVASDLLRETVVADRDVQKKLGQLDLRSSARQYLNNFSTSLAGLKNFYQSYLATVPVAGTDAKKRAEEHKERGNQLVSEGKENEAVDEYNKAIELDKKNAVYYCNRAAAYTGLGKYEDAIHDCHLSLAADSKYVKAFGRLGVACLKADRLVEARRATERALELEPSNDRYKTNLALIDERMQQEPNSSFRGVPPSPTSSNASSQRPSAAPAGGGLGGMGFDPSMISGMLSNPQFMNMAQQVMGDPRIQQAMGSVASSLSGAFQQQPQPNQPTSNSNDAGGGGGANAPPAGGAGFNINDLLGNLSSQLFRPDSDLTRNIWEAAQQATTGGRQPQQPPNTDGSKSSNPPGQPDSSSKDDKDKKPDDPNGKGAGGSGPSYFS